MVVRTKDRRWQELEKGDISLERLARHFEAHNRSEGKSPRTVEWYGQVLRRFKDYLEGQGYSIKLGDLTLDVAKGIHPDILAEENDPACSSNPWCGKVVIGEPVNVCREGIDIRDLLS